MILIEELIVTQIEPKLKHPTIFKHFDALDHGEGFIINNDHDPKPLYYQLLGERGNTFSWKYLEEGPETWRVQISKNQEAKAGETVGEMVAKDIRKAEVFKKMGIDFCCGGNKTLKEAGEAAGISEEEINAALERVDEVVSQPALDMTKWSPNLLADYIVETHHRYVKEQSPLLMSLAEKVAAHHELQHPELKRLVQGVRHFLEELHLHLVKEEEILFPAIKELNLLNEDPKTSPEDAHAIQTVINLMVREHEVAGEDLVYFRKLTNNYTLPADACNSYAYLFDKMAAFENDLHMHIHLENNLLFPKVSALLKQ
ncbi:MAG TPA: iron-sulfur cluster repair di-iron protein [Ferruginibacter sp.]|nr:iron-sulfur cluster repair di-iron protein [Ferruginibacter sp.]HRO05556.1 iron-sulfur cluster repair di-iron protein [Ferruginibacter sp.]HRO96306.1 iron-sulfur cluster repair di-iron protein [Ferruginibacter sp.]HRP49400.1 iron-sulfur cluster repair di-iron protein [Ferruginibacter sp.]